jgi:PhzF family phenazine biosynthesis protein
MKKNQNIKVAIINAFVDNNDGGNPAGVVLDADNLSNHEKLVIAQKVGLSETAFVSKSNTADFKLDFFTPTKQIAHCGHATIATFSYLSQLGKIQAQNSSKETIDGNREIYIEKEVAFMEQKAPAYTTTENHKQLILTSLGLKDSDLLNNAPILVVNTGNAFAIIPVASMEILKAVEPDFDLISQISDEYDLIGYYVFSTQTNIKDRDASTRMFAPRYGIQEEAGTGMAAGPLASYLYDILDLKKERYHIEQGNFMTNPSPSLIIVDISLEAGQITKIMAGGKGIFKEQISINI